MKHSCYSKIFLLFLLFSSSLFASLHEKSAIVYYGENISYPMVGIHDYIIVEPDNINTNTHGFKVYNEKMYAYVSIGEIVKSSPEYKTMDKTLLVGNNSAWSSAVLDITNPQYKKFLFQKLIEPLIKRGFKNFFFDTLDSYQLVCKDKRSKKAAQNALVSIIKTFHKRYPNAKLVLNRGFEIIDRIHNDINAVLFESYYYGIGGENLSYSSVSAKDRKWLDHYLDKIKQYKIDIIAVDYLPFNEFYKADKLAKSLQKKGFIPYVTNRELDTYGVSSKNPLKREILFLTDARGTDQIYLDAHTTGSLPLEYQGYIPKVYNIYDGLPNIEKVMRRYAGVVIWLERTYTQPYRLIAWVKKLTKLHIPIVFAGSFWIDLSNEILAPLGLRAKTLAQREDDTVVTKDKMMGFEIEPPQSTAMHISGKAIVKELYTLQNKSGNRTTLAAITTWGGYAVSGTFTIVIQNDTMWSINPFAFYREALRLKPLLIPDPTTENGKRIFFTHIDGDAAASRVEWNPDLFCTEVLYKEIFTHYKVPQSISIIGGELNNKGLYPKLSKRLEDIAKKIYAIDYVEGASHTYSHPFDWMKINSKGILPVNYRLPIKGYKFSLHKEIEGNINYINKVLMPKDKPKKLLAKTIYWTGSCNPPYKILDRVYRDGYLNMNGGDTTIVNQTPWLSRIAPYGLSRKNYQQIYTGEQDENVYTYNWTKKFWGFRNVIQTYKLTNSPRRFKPIDIYYHFYSGSKRASLNALKYVFDWTLSQDIIPMFTSEYIPKAMDFYSVSMAQSKNEWLVSGMKYLKTLRTNNKNLFIDLQYSADVVGESDFEKQRYFHLYKKENYLTLSKKISQKYPYLISSNGFIKNYENNKKSRHYLLESYRKLKVDLYLPRECTLHTSEYYQIKKEAQRVSLLFNVKKAKIDVLCR